MSSEIKDIEDMIIKDDLNDESRLKTNSHVVVKRTEHYDKNNTIVESFVPGTNKIFMKTWGCSHNNSDSEYMAGLLSQSGYDLTDNKEEADLWLLNSCTVKSPAEDHFRNEIISSLKSGKKVVLAGCVPQGQRKAEYIKGLSVIGVQQIDKVCQVVEETLKGNTVSFLASKKVGGKRVAGASLSLPKVRKNPLIEIIPVNTGCLNNCTYCKTKHARGNLVSYPLQEIINRAISCFNEGVVEIWLTSEDLGAYGRDIGTTLPELLKDLIKVIPSTARLRLGMTNPPYILEHLEAIAEVLNHNQVYKFLHVPVQSGSDMVLFDMKREYTNNDFCTVCDVLKNLVPNINIATDIICGFPTETEKNFEDTMSLVEKYTFPSLFINQYFPRPGTPAAGMQKVHPQEVKKRTKRLHDLFYSYRPYDNMIGSKEKILVTEIATDGINYVGHTSSYYQVILEPDPKIMGKIVTVKIIETGKHFMKGVVINDDSMTLIDNFFSNEKYCTYLLSLSTFSFILYKLMRKVNLF